MTAAVLPRLNYKVNNTKHKKIFFNTSTYFEIMNISPRGEQFVLRKKSRGINIHDFLRQFKIITDLTRWSLTKDTWLKSAKNTPTSLSWKWVRIQSFLKQDKVAFYLVIYLLMLTSTFFSYWVVSSFFAEIQLWVFVRLQAKCRTSVSCYCQCYKCQYINKMFAEVLKALLYKPNNSLKFWNTSNLNKSVHINITWSISNYSKSAAVFL